MRITISLNDRLATQVRREAKAQGVSMSAFVAKTLGEALKRREPTTAPPFRLITVRGTKVRAGVDLDRPSALDLQEDEARFEKLEP